MTRKTEMRAAKPKPNAELSTTPTWSGVNTVEVASVPYNDVREAAIRALPEREQRKVRRADRQAELTEERRRRDEAKDARIAAEVAAYRRSKMREYGAIAAARVMEGLNPLIIAAGGTSPAAAAAMTAPGVLKARKDLREMGIDVLKDPDAVLNLVSTGMMLYGPPARRIGNFRALERIARDRYGIPPDKLTGRAIGALPIKDQLMIKRATRFERGAQGLGVETLVDPDVRLLPPTGKSRVIRPEDLPSELREAVSPAYARGNIEYEQFYPVTVNRVPLEALQKGNSPTPGHRASTIFGRYRPAYHTIEVAEYPRDSFAQHETFIHEMDHALRYPFRKFNDKSLRPNKRLGQELYGADLEPYVKSYYKMPEEVDAFVTAERNWLSPSERLTSLRMDTAKYFTRPLKVAAKNAQVTSDLRRVFETDTQQDSKGGDAGPETAVSETPVSEIAPAPQGGPRIVINPTTFHNKKDALCVAFNEGFRVWMEANDFQPQSEPTDAQRKFFSDTAYADDELQLRRTILARIATFDTSVKDPTDDQLAETGSFLDAILESDWCKNDWERNAVSRLSQAVKASVGAEPVEPRPEPIEPREPEPLQSRAALGGGETEDEKKEAIVAANGAELDAQAKEHVDAANRTLESLDQHIESAEALGKVADDWNKTTDQILAQGEEILSGGNEQGAAQPQNAQGAAQEPAGAQGAVQPGNEQAQPQNAPQGQEEPSQRNPQGTQSGVWTGGAPGKGRQLTEREAEWTRQRIESGATVSGQQLSMFGLQRNERGAIVDSAGNAFNGFGGEEKKPLPGSPDAKLDDRERKRRKA